MAIKITHEKYIEKYGHGGLDPWRGQLRQRVRRPVQEPRRAWNDVPKEELRHSSGKDGAALTADALYPKAKPATYEQAQAEQVARQDVSPLGGKAKPNEAADAAWAKQAQARRERGW
jgi:hypothetical protein